MINKFLLIVLCALSYSQILIGESWNQYETITPHHKTAKIYHISHINNAGQIIGTAYANRKNQIFIWSGNEEMDFYIYDREQLNSPGYPPFINNNGKYSYNPISDDGAEYFIDKDSHLRKIFGNESILLDTSSKWVVHYTTRLRVNNTGKILGSIENGPGKTSMAVYDELKKSLFKIPIPLKYQVTPVDINDMGWVVGSYYDGFTFNGILWIPELGTLIIENFLPAAVNNNGIIVGSTRPVYGSGQTRGVVWENGMIYDISNEMCIDRDFSNEFLCISEIWDINDSNEMVGEGSGIVRSDKIPVYLKRKR